MSKINLVPDIRVEKIKTKRRNFVVTFFAIIIIVVLVTTLVILQGYRVFQKVSLDSTNKNIVQTKEELKEYAGLEKTITNIEQGLKAVDDISKNEPRWSLFLPQLEKATPNDIKFTGFTQEGTAFKASVSGQKVVSIARLIKSLESYEFKKNEGDEENKKLFKNVTITGYTRDAESGLLTAEVSFELEGGLLW